VDAGPADPAQPHGSRSGVLLDLVPGWHALGQAGAGGGPALDDRECVRNRPNRTRPDPQRDPLLARLASTCVARHARVRHDGSCAPTRQQPRLTPKKKRRGQAAALVCWSVQDIRRVATRLAQRRIEPAFGIAWSAWRRAHQAIAQASHRKPHIVSERCNCSASVMGHWVSSP
jgi:hypothetical protein